MITVVIGVEDRDSVEVMVGVEDREGEKVVVEIDAQGDESERDDEDTDDIGACLFCAKGAFRTLGLGWLSTYTNVCCLSWPEHRERRLGDELLSFVLVLPGIAGPLEECLELICSSP